MDRLRVNMGTDITPSAINQFPKMSKCSALKVKQFCFICFDQAVRFGQVCQEWYIALKHKETRLVLTCSGFPTIGHFPWLVIITHNDDSCGTILVDWEVLLIVRLSNRNSSAMPLCTAKSDVPAPSIEIFNLHSHSHYAWYTAVCSTP